MNLSDLIERNAAFTPDKAAIRFAGAELTYAGLAKRIAEAARGLKSELGVGRGDRVAILAANHPDYLVLLYACARLGAMLVPINWRLAIPEQLFILKDAGVKALVVEQAFARDRRAAGGGDARRARRGPRFCARGRSRVRRACSQAPAATAAATTSIQPLPC